MLEMVGKSSFIQSSTILVGIGSLSQVLFGSFSTSFLIPSDDIGSKLVKGVQHTSALGRYSWSSSQADLMRGQFYPFGQL